MAMQKNEPDAGDTCEVDSSALSHSSDMGVGFWSVILWFCHPSDLGINKRKPDNKQDCE